MDSLRVHAEIADAHPADRSHVDQRAVGAVGPRAEDHLVFEAENTRIRFQSEQLAALTDDMLQV